MRHFPLFALFLFCGILLNGCGLTPVYGTKSFDSGVAAELARTSISSIPEKEGVDLRNELVDRMHIQGTPPSPRFNLVVSPITERSVGLGISKDASVTRYQLRMGARMTLKDSRTEETLLERDVSAITSYNVLDSHFTTLVSEREARTNGVKELAEQIILQLDLYFSASEAR